MLQILLVEDEANLRTRCRKLLEDRIGGCIVAGEAANGLEALEWLKTHTVDAVITDIRMKDMDGIEMLKRLKEQSPFMPVVIISGYSDFIIAREALRYEVTDYLLKPIDQVELTQVIQKLFKRIKGPTPLQRELFNEQGSPSPSLGVSGDNEVKERQIIRKIKEIIALRLEQDISLQYLAEQVNLNHRYLSALFKMETGVNLSDYVTQSRIEKAKGLLKHTRLKVQDISRLTGYPNVKYFMSVFKHRVGCTPTEYRDSSPLI
jgi:two-component system response regulator YesN